MTKKKIFQSPALFVVPYATLFILLIALPVLAALALSFTSFNTIQTPVFVGLQNYVDIITGDSVFLQKALPNTLLFSVIVGPIGYMMSFGLAWMLAQVPHKIRTFYAVLIYSPSITGAINISAMLKLIHKTK